MRVGLGVNLDCAPNPIPGGWRKPGQVFYLPVLSFSLLNLGRLF